MGFCWMFQYSAALPLLSNVQEISDTREAHRSKLVGTSNLIFRVHGVTCQRQVNGITCNAIQVHGLLLKCVAIALIFTWSP